MADKKIIKFELVTPEKVVLKEAISQITVPTKMGEITVLPDHIPLVASLKPGVIDIVKENGEAEIISISGGFIEVLRDKVVILADTAERAHEIDLERAEVAQQRAEGMMKSEKQMDRETFANITGLVEKQLARTKAVKKWRRTKNISNITHDIKGNE